jgi:hypothetical protein
MLLTGKLPIEEVWSALPKASVAPVMISELLTLFSVNLALEQGVVTEGTAFPSSLASHMSPLLADEQMQKVVTTAIHTTIPNVESWNEDTKDDWTHVPKSTLTKSKKSRTPLAARLLEKALEGSQAVDSDSGTITSDTSQYAPSSSSSSSSFSFGDHSSDHSGSEKPSRNRRSGGGDPDDSGGDSDSSNDSASGDASDESDSNTPLSYKESDQSCFDVVTKGKLDSIPEKTYNEIKQVLKDPENQLEKMVHQDLTFREHTSFSHSKAILKKTSLTDESKLKEAQAMGKESFAQRVRAPTTDPLSLAKFEYDGHKLPKLMGKVALALCCVTDEQVEKICEQYQVKAKTSDLSTASITLNRRLLQLGQLVTTTRKKWSPFIEHIFKGYYSQATNEYSLDPSMESHEMLPYVIKHMRQLIKTNLKVEKPRMQEHLARQCDSFRVSDLHGTKKDKELLRMFSGLVRSWRAGNTQHSNIGARVKRYQCARMDQIRKVIEKAKAEADQELLSKDKSIAALARLRENSPNGTVTQAKYFLLKEELQFLVDWAENSKNCRTRIYVESSDGVMTKEKVTHVQSLIMMYYVFERRHHVWACRSKCKEAEERADGSKTKKNGGKSKAATINQVSTSAVVCHHCGGDHYKRNCSSLQAGKPATEKGLEAQKKYFDAKKARESQHPSMTGKGAPKPGSKGGGKGKGKGKGGKGKGGKGGKGGKSSSAPKNDSKNDSTPSKTVSFVEELGSDDDDVESHGVNAIRTGGGVQILTHILKL